MTARGMAEAYEHVGYIYVCVLVYVCVCVYGGSVRACRLKPNSMSFMSFVVSF
jgi:hypothetical protein